VSEFEDETGPGGNGEGYLRKEVLGTVEGYESVDGDIFMGISMVAQGLVEGDGLAGEPFDAVLDGMGRQAKGSSDGAVAHAFTAMPEDVLKPACAFQIVLGTESSL